MADDSDGKREVDGVETSKVGIGNPCTNERGEVNPELIERGDTGGSTLTHSQGTGLAFWIRVRSSGRRERALNEIGEDNGGTIVGEALAKFDEGDGESLGRDFARHSSESMELLFGGEVLGVEVAGQSGLAVDDHGELSGVSCRT